MATTPSVGDPTRQELIAAIITEITELQTDLAATIGDRMVINGSFESDGDADNIPDGWETDLYTGGSEGRSEDVGAGTLSGHGKWSYRFTHPGGGGNGGGEIFTAAGVFMEITPHRPYMLTWLNKNSVAAVTNSVEVLEYDAEQSLLATTVIFTQSTNPTAWTLFKVKFKPANTLTRYIQLKFKCGETSASTAGVIYIDNIQLQFASFENAYHITRAGAGTWTAPAGVKCVDIEIVGGGGGGGSNNGGGSNGGGGGGGGYSRALISVTSGTAYTYAIGAAGTAGVGGNGGAGGNSTITVGATTLTANGGNGGAGDGGAGTGGSGGTASGGDINSTGGTGGAAGGAIGGIGGIVTPIGISAAGSAGSTAGITGQHMGAGGSGAVNANGGAGADGGLIIRW